MAEIRFADQAWRRARDAAHAVEEADERAQACDAQASVRDGPGLGARLVREQRRLDRGERLRELRPRGIAIGRELTASEKSTSTRPNRKEYHRKARRAFSIDQPSSRAATT